MELGLGHSALQLVNCIFTTYTLELDQESALDFLSEKSRYRRNIWMENNHLSIIMCGVGGDDVGREMGDLRTFVRSPAPSGAFMEILPFLSRYVQREAAVSEGVAGGRSSVFCPPTFSPVLGVGQVDHRAVRAGARTLSVTV